MGNGTRTASLLWTLIGLITASGSQLLVAQTRPAPMFRPGPAGVPPVDRLGQSWMEPAPHSAGAVSPNVPLDPTLPPPPPGWDPAVFWADGQPGELLPPLTTHRNGFFQWLEVSAAWLPQLGGELGITEVKTDLTVALPAPTPRFPLLISPVFHYYSLSGPTTIDAPPEVFETWLEAMWVPSIGERWRGFLSVAPGVYADFDAYGSDAFRMTGRAIVNYRWRPDQLELFAGLLYLNRNDYLMLPAGGILWVPNRDTRLEIFFPKPKLARRYRWGQRFEDWVYIGGEFGGNTYWVRRRSGVEDLITLRDWRIYFGTERKWDGGSRLQLELGYIFSRVIEYRRDSSSYPFDDTLMLRLTWRL